MPAYPTLDYLPDLGAADMDWAWELDLRTVTDPELAQYYGRTARYGTSDPYAQLDDIFAFHAIGGMGYTVQSGSWFDPYRTVVHDDLGNAIAADDGSGDYGYDYVSFIAPYTGWYYVDASWSQDAYDSYASVNVYEHLLPPTNVIVGTGAHDTLYGTRADDIVDGGEGNVPGSSISVTSRRLPGNSNLAMHHDAATPPTAFTGTAIAATSSVKRIAASVSGSRTVSQAGPMPRRSASVNTAASGSTRNSSVTASASTSTSSRAQRGSSVAAVRRTRALTPASAGKRHSRRPPPANGAHAGRTPAGGAHARLRRSRCCARFSVSRIAKEMHSMASPTAAAPA